MLLLVQSREEQKYIKLSELTFDAFLKEGAGKEKTVLPRQSMAATGGGPSTADLTSVDCKIAAIIGEVRVCGIVSEKEGDTDVTETTEEQVLLESEAVGEQEGLSDADAQRPAQSSAPSASGTSKNGRVLTDAVLQLQQETNAVNRVADELWQMREVMQEIAQSLKYAVKTRTLSFVFLYKRHMTSSRMLAPC
ncbi:myb-related transcription factor, partner of profilin-like [Tachysurus ichikawai]